MSFKSFARSFEHVMHLHCVEFFEISQIPKQKQNYVIIVENMLSYCIAVVEQQLYSWTIGYVIEWQCTWLLTDSYALVEQQPYNCWIIAV